VKIRNVIASDATSIADMYNHYILNTAISFEEQAVTAADMAQRFEDVQVAGLPWLVMEDDGELIGYAYASRWRVRAAYRFSVESTVYLLPGKTGKGAGAQLYAALLERLRGSGCHTVIGGIALPNPASVALHEKLGFKQVARFQDVGFKFDRWIDVGYWQIVLDEAH
jgi:L-amino acid N-acyltransferase YncA